MALEPKDRVQKGSIFDALIKKKISRKEFMKLCLIGVGGIVTSGTLSKFAFSEETSTGRIGKNAAGKYDIVAAKGEDIYQMTVRAIEVMGGMEKFVTSGDKVVIKPNMAWDRTPEQACNTNPEVVAALIDLAFKAGAKRINVFDRSTNYGRRAYEYSGIAKVAKEKGANVFFLDDWNVVKAHFPYKSQMEGWPIYRDAIECDTFINVPVLKHHGLTELTLSMKNLMGVCGGTRGQMHNNIGIKLVHLTDFIKPDLTVIDAYKVLVRNGPSGGSLDDLEAFNTLIVGTDPALTDSYAAELVGKDPLAITYIKEARDNNFGNIDTKSARISKIEV